MEPRPVIGAGFTITLSLLHSSRVAMLVYRPAIYFYLARETCARMGVRANSPNAGAGDVVPCAVLLIQPQMIITEILFE